MTEHVRDVSCFGGCVTVRASGTGATGFAAPAALVMAEALLLRVHARLSCFDRGSELSRLNDDGRPRCPRSGTSRAPSRGWEAERRARRRDGSGAATSASAPRRAARAYGMLGLGLTFYVRRRLGSQRWRRAHRAIPAFWALAVGHAVLTGTDTGAWWFLAAVWLPVLAAGALLAQRHAGAPERPRAPAPDRG